MEEREKERLDKLREGLKVAKKKSYHKSKDRFFYTYVLMCLLHEPDRKVFG
jgi:hypothetical protein